MQTPGVEPVVDDVDDGVELDDVEQEAEAGEELDLGEDAGDEPDDGSEPSGGPPAPPARRPGRAERRAAEIRELRERLERQDRELAQVRGQIQQPPRVDPAELMRREQQEREHLQMLDPDQRIAYWRNKDRQEFSQALVNQRVELGETLDKRDWDNACRTDTVRSRFSARVEAALSSERQAGRNPSREAVFKYLYGEAALEQRQRQAGRQRRDGAARVRAQTTQPAGGRSDVQRDRRQVDDSYEAALRRVRESGRPLW